MFDDNFIRQITELRDKCNELLQKDGEQIKDTTLQEHKHDGISLTEFSAECARTFDIPPGDSYAIFMEVCRQHPDKVQVSYEGQLFSLCDIDKGFNNPGIDEWYFEEGVTTANDVLCSVLEVRSYGAIGGDAHCHFNNSLRTVSIRQEDPQSGIELRSPEYGGNSLAVAKWNSAIRAFEANDYRKLGEENE